MNVVAPHIGGRPLLRRAPPVLVQSLVYSATSGTASVLAAFTTALLARHMTTNAFGAFSFCVSFLLFLAMFAELGVFVPAARLLARSEPEVARDVAGGAVVLFVPIAVAFSLIVAAVSPAIGPVFGVHAGHALLLTAGLAAAYPLVQFSLLLAQGASRLHLYSVAALAAQCLFGVGLALLIVSGRLSIASALAVRGGAFFVCLACAVALLRPRFAAALKYSHALVADARTFGLHLYVGRVLSVGTYNMDVLMLAALAGPRPVGFYALAGSIAVASGIPMTGMASAIFPRMTRDRTLDGRWLAAAGVFSGVVLLAAVALAGPFVRLVFSSRYAPAIGLVGPLVLAQGIRSVTTVYNTFLTAQARGRELRNAAVVLTAANVVLNFALIPPFGATGAAWASAGALAANYIAHWVAYRRYLRELDVSP